MEKINYCPECHRKFDSYDKETFCSDCGIEILERDPEIDVKVEMELSGDIVTSTSILMSLEEFFELAKKKKLIK
jgi:hypothetical protein